MNRERGNILVTILVVGIIVIGGYISWQLYQKLTAIDTTSIVSDPFHSTPNPSAQDSNWKLVQVLPLHLTLKVPGDWLTSGSNYVAEYTYSPNDYSNQNTYNLIQIDKLTEQLEPSYPSDTFFDTLYGMKNGQTFTNYYFSDRTPINKISDGHIASGQRYVIVQYKDETDKKAFILQGVTLYEFDLLYQNQQGEQLFAPILQTVKLADS